MKVATKLCTVCISIHFLLGLCNTNAIQQEDFPIVRTNLGQIRGRSMTTRLGQLFFAFRGIKYAEAPVNELRFQVYLILLYKFYLNIYVLFTKNTFH